MPRFEQQHEFSAWRSPVVLVRGIHETDVPSCDDQLSAAGVPRSRRDCSGSANDAGAFWRTCEQRVVIDPSRAQTPAHTFIDLAVIAGPGPRRRRRLLLGAASAGAMSPEESLGHVRTPAAGLRS